VDSFCPETPYNVFRVRQGKKYRFRLIGGTCTSCAYKFSIEQHTLLIIAVDGSPVEPVRVNSVDMFGGVLRKYYTLHTEKLAFGKQKEKLQNTLSVYPTENCL
jgi:hypothetical protein